MRTSRARHALGALTTAAALAAAPAVAHGRPAGTPAPAPAASAPTPPLAPPLVGVVRDTTGAPLANVQVVVAGLNRVITTDEQGGFVFRGLPAGRYHLDAVLIGYARADVDVVIPQTGPDVRVEIVLRATALRLSNVVVTASPTGADPLRITQSTVELSGKELNRALGASVAQTLSGEPGLAVRYNGPGATTPVVRGLTGDRVLVLQDGDRAGDLASSAADHGLSIDPLTAQRIEVVRGPASLLYGTNALGGVVNVISNDIPTEIPTRLDGYVATQAESVNPGAAGVAALTLPLGRSLALTARGGVRRAEDVYQGGRRRLDNSFNRNQNALLGFGYVGDGLRAGVAYRAYGFDYGLPVAPGDDERAHIEGQRQEVRGRADLGVNAGPLRYLRAEGTAQWYDHDEVESDGAIGTTFRLRTQTLNLTSKTRLGRLEGAIGAQALLRQYAAAGEEALTPEARTRNGALFIYQELPLGAAADTAEHGADEHASGVRLQLGARFDVFDLRSKDGDEKFGPGRARTFDNFSGSVGLSVPLADRVTLGLSAARAFRAPTVEELYSNAFHAAVGTYDVGNPELRAEINQGIDGVVRAQRGSVDAQLSAYYNRIDDFITPNVVGAVDAETGEPPVGAGDATVPLNVFTQRDARLYGAEGRVEVDVGRRVVVGALGDVVRGEFVAGGALPFMPPARLGALARWDNGRWSVAGDVRRAFAQDRTSQASCGRAGGSAPEADELGVPCVDLSTPAYTLLNLSVGYTLYRGQRLHALTLRADNLLDEAYFDAASRIKYFARSPGRNVSLVYRVQF